jgi:protein-S-isoprenylcysteine O-methyltransferase Ste14
MNEPALLLVLLVFAAIAVLTVTFFQNDGRLSAKWWATALPYFLCPAFLVGAYLAALPPITPAGWTRASALVSVVLAAGSLAVLCFARAAHRVPISVFHQHDAVPGELVTHGVYSRIRHPFYTSYLLLFCAAVALFPHWATFGVLIYACVTLDRTAAGEERRLAGGSFGPQYRQYMARTGRFVPRLTRPAASDPDPPAPSAPAAPVRESMRSTKR